MEVAQSGQSIFVVLIKTVAALLAASCVPTAVDPAHALDTFSEASQSRPFIVVSYERGTPVLLWG